MGNLIQQQRQREFFDPLVAGLWIKMDRWNLEPPEFGHLKRVKLHIPFLAFFRVNLG
jgi:hypothetical protein